MLCISKSVKKKEKLFEHTILFYAWLQIQMYSASQNNFIILSVKNYINIGKKIILIRKYNTCISANNMLSFNSQWEFLCLYSILDIWQKKMLKEMTSKLNIFEFWVLTPTDNSHIISCYLT